MARAYSTLPGVQTAGAYCIGLAPDDSQLYCCVASAFSPCISIYSMVPQAADANAAAAQDGADIGCGVIEASAQLLSVFQTRPLPDGSPMKVCELLVVTKYHLHASEPAMCRAHHTAQGHRSFRQLCVKSASVPQCSNTECFALSQCSPVVLTCLPLRCFSGGPVCTIAEHL